ncbi:hypothetical protein DOTSEDRAFT_69658 [Dothistroma septosporum NZE10]|uniref:F-box domain-containing protein n=1 Tax=Dothistroma septosporum (strain NZE10 / CBS 128990) TaxID=675120 RepID=N1PZH1_DOTSN|nr:hypothetical protein DOTSEDRAFT_69658 [Dothistroma septosporum NZE10]
MDGDISDLMMGVLSGNGRDEFGKSPGQRNVLLLDRTMQRQRDPASRLLQLPTELLADIVEMLANDQSTLASLALVNIECRQLARTRQFCEILFNYSPNSRCLLDHLLHEVAERRRASRSAPNSDTTTVRESTISACIRHVKVASSPSWVRVYHQELYQSIWGESPEPISHEEREVLERQADNVYTAYRDRLLIAIATAMPNIESLAWHDRYGVTPGFFSMLRITPIKRLKLSRVPIQTPFVLTGPPWPLRSLHLNICTPLARSVGNEAVDPYELADFVDSVLRLCASSLQHLHLGSSALPTFMSREVPSFPLLRTYRSSWGARIAPATLSSVLTASLVELELGQWNTGSNTEHMAVLEACEPCKRLESLVWSNIDGDNVGATVSFLTQHKLIKKLHIDHSAHKELEQQIVPLLARSGFDFLTSLSLAWEPVGNRVNQINQEIPPHVAKIPVESLAAIGTITSLQQLYLSAGQHAGWRCQWLIDHDALRTCLRPLQRLRKLALSRDSYQFKHYAEVESYYVHRRPWLSAQGRERERRVLDSEMRWFEAAAQRKAEAEEESRREPGDVAYAEHAANSMSMINVIGDDYDQLAPGMTRPTCRIILNTRRLLIRDFRRALGTLSPQLHPRGDREVCYRVTAPLFHVCRAMAGGHRTSWRWLFM